MADNLKSILVIEDNQDISALYTHILEIDGYRVVIAVSGEQAWEKLLIEQFDLLLLDISLPDISGLQLLERVRLSERIGIASIPVVIITGKSSLEEEKAASDFGVHSYIVKPFNPQFLRETLRILFS